MAKKIMIVDDAPFMRMMLRDILEKNSYEVIAEAEDGQQAVELYEKLKPELVLLDITMPKLDGLEALKQIMAIDGSAKVIMCSAMSQQDLVMKSVSLGATDYVTKPFNADRIIQTLNKID